MNSTLVKPLLLVVVLSSFHANVCAKVFPRHQLDLKKTIRRESKFKQLPNLFGVRGGSSPSSPPDLGSDDGYYHPQQRGVPRTGGPPANESYDNHNSHGNPPPQDPRMYQQTTAGGNPYREPELPPPSLPGGDNDEPPFPDSPYRSSGPGPTQQSQHQRYQQQPPPRQAAPRTPPPQNSHQQATSQQTLNDAGGSDLELESFDKNLIFQGLKRMYRKKILPLEISSKYGHFHSPPLSPSDFDAKPMVLLLGQYSVGKTSFIRYLLGRDFPGIRVGPEPTTDRFTCILNGEKDKVIPGAALVSQSDRPFRGLSPFGNNFLSKLEAVEIDAPILRNITLVDTPGILSGAKQSVGRNYDYDGVMKWYAERADLIIIMFDAHKLDISDELKRVIEMMKPHADKVRVVLNKADSISTQQLMRVYGALMWQLGKVMNTPEVCRVYMGSFWGAPLKNNEQAALLNSEKLDLFRDIAQLPQNAVMRRINELVKRARGVKVHAYIIHYLRKQLPYTFGKKEKQARLINQLERELDMCARRYELPRGDFPPVKPLRHALLEINDLSEFPKLDKKMVKEMDKVFSVDIPLLLEKARGE